MRHARVGARAPTGHDDSGNHRGDTRRERDPDEPCALGPHDEARDIVIQGGGQGQEHVANVVQRPAFQRPPNGGMFVKRTYANGPTPEGMGPSVLRERLARGPTQIY